MTLFFLYAILIIVGALMGVLLSRTQIFSRFPASVMSLMAALAVAGGFLLQLEYRHLQDKLTERAWPTVTGYVIEARIDTNRALMPRIQYEYTVGGKTFTGVTDLHIPAFGGKAKRLETADQVVRAYPSGRSVTVHYNPQQPEQSALRVGPTWDIFMKLGFGGFLLLLSSAGLVLGWSLRRKTIS